MGLVPYERDPRKITWPFCHEVIARAAAYEEVGTLILGFPTFRIVRN